VGTAEGRLTQIDQRIRQVGGLNQNQVDARVRNGLQPLEQRLTREANDLRTRAGSNNAAIGENARRITAEANARSRADGNLGQQINQLQTNIDSVGASVAGQTATFNRLNARINVNGASIIDLQNNRIIPLERRVTNVEGSVVPFNVTSVRTQLNSLSSGWGRIETTFDLWRQSMAAKRSGASTDANNAAAHFSAARGDIAAWERKKIDNLDRGISAVNEIVEGVFDLGAATIKLVNWANDVEASYRDLKLQAGSQKTTVTSLRQSF
jgi:hypothetical protein